MSNGEQQFRESLRSFRWASSSNNANISTSKPTAFSQLAENTSNFFGSIGNRVQGYLPLANNNTEQEDEWFTLTRWQRLAGFGVLFASGALCFLIAFVSLPLLALKPRKFAVAFTMGSLLILSSFALLYGPFAHLRHIVSRERLPFTITYIGSMAATLYFAIGLRSTIPTIIFSVLQVIALLWYTVSYLPGGTTTLRFGSRMVARQASDMFV
ncbi:3053_t:CDS:2 [Gigaspora margarita]|uniref:Protein transport protein SFT2 n=1 Tax=Gigaspora margarita TaxID=4874 RepID=A0ABN7VA39_GIGMA|nr:3053_t:CDS:2 [Gigaspora margarita]